MALFPVLFYSSMGADGLPNQGNKTIKHRSVIRSLWFTGLHHLMPLCQYSTPYVLSHFSRVWLCDPWTVAHQAPLSMRFSRQEHWSGLPFSSPGDLPDPGIESGSPTLQTDSLPSEQPGKHICHWFYPDLRGHTHLQKTAHATWNSQTE